MNSLAALIAVAAWPLVVPVAVGETPPKSLQAVAATLDTLVDAGVIVGGQVAISRGDQLLLSHAAGAQSIRSPGPVSNDTLFLIGSCSKPFASATVLRMHQGEAFDFSLNDRIDQWLPAFASASVDGDGPVRRAPEIAELLCHRAGIFSQKVGITRVQEQLIYTFNKTLKDGVKGIAAQPLLAQPGERFAYSGAGYCVLGRVAELIAGDDPVFESLLQQHVCTPLGLTHTTYFPSGRFDKIATGFAANKAPHALGDQHLWPLIGGSLYSTAEEMVRFAQAVAGWIETIDREAFFNADTWSELEVQRTPDQDYTLGWSALRENGRPVRFSHSGSLQGYRGYIAFDRRSQICVAATYTLATPRSESEATAKIRKTLHGVLDESGAEGAE